MVDTLFLGRLPYSGRDTIFDWKPTLNLGKKDYSKEYDLQAAAARADRGKDHDQARQSLLEQQQ